MPTKEEQKQSGCSGPSACAPEIAIRMLRGPEDAAAFRALNEEWIRKYFVVEPKDRETLDDPENAIIRKGGYIFVVEREREAVGCAALIPVGNDCFELSKMAVSPQLRGVGIGRILIHHVIAHARAIGATSLFLGSSTKLANAVHLYESVGFVHVPREMIPPMKYDRSDVFMRMELTRELRSQ